MKLIIVLLVLAFSKHVASQTLTLSELANIHNNHLLVDFEDILIAKGFELEPKGLDELKLGKDFKVYGFAKDMNFVVTKIVRGNINLMTTFMSTKVEDYQSLKKELTVNGFKFINTDEDFSHHTYQNEDGIEVSLTTQFVDELNKNAYVINVIDRKNKEYLSKLIKK